MHRPLSLGRRSAFDEGNCITDASTRSIVTAASGGGGGSSGGMNGNGSKSGGAGDGAGDGAGSGDRPHPMRLWTFIFAGFLTGEWGFKGECIICKTNNLNPDWSRNQMAGLISIFASLCSRRWCGISKKRKHQIPGFEPGCCRDPCTVRQEYDRGNGSVECQGCFRCVHFLNKSCISLTMGMNESEFMNMATE